MSDIQWGPEIKVYGKKPEWLEHDEKVLPQWGSYWYPIMGGAPAKCVADWLIVTAIRIPADHWYYQQQPIELNDYDDHQALRDVLDEAYEQAANGKGKERHANGNAWLNQPIFEIGRMVGVGFNTGQAIKKLQESSRMEPDAAVRELLGAIVYAASAIQLIRETSQHNNETENAE